MMVKIFKGVFIFFDVQFIYFIDMGYMFFYEGIVWFFLNYDRYLYIVKIDYYF